MTTNSPNPVDGDVQALIQVCNNQIELFNKMLADDYYIHTWETVSLHLTIAKTALAALTAEPVVEVSTWWPLGVDGGEQPFLQSLGNLPAKGSKLYTTPPAQLLRPVELPDCVDDLHGVGPVMSAYAVVEALRQQGYEVKND